MINGINTDGLVYIIELAEESISNIKSDEADYLRRILERVKDEASS